MNKFYDSVSYPVPCIADGDEGRFCKREER